MVDDLDNEQGRLRAAFELQRATEFLEELDRLNAQVGPLMTEDVDRAMQARAARIEAAGNSGLARRFLSAWNAQAVAARARDQDRTQATIDALDDAIEEFERALADTEAWFKRTK
jgi:cytochrome c peroxidase